MMQVAANVSRSSPWRLIPLLLGLAMNATGADSPIEVNADRTSMDKKVMIADGKATFSDGKVVIHADHLEYDSTKKTVRCQGPAEAEIGGVTVALADLFYDISAHRVAAGDGGK
jgi:lipopolysaccharide export system protein LptA